MRPTRSRLHRSELAVPGSNVRMLEKAPALGADIVMLDLEDAVAPDDKPQARANVIDALNEGDWARLLGVAEDQRPGHPLLLPRHRRRRGAGGAASGLDHDPQGVGRGRRAPRGHAADPDRGGDGAGAQDRHLRAHRDGHGDGEVRGDRRRLPGADGGDGFRRGRLCGVAAEPHHLDRRDQPRLRNAGRPRGNPLPRTGARAPSRRPVALRAVADRRGLPRLRATPDRRALRGLHRSRGLPGVGAARGRPRL